MPCALRMLLVVVALGWLNHSLARGDELLVGVSATDITPGESYPVSGYYNERLSTGTKDPLQAKAMVFKQGDLTAAFVVCDLISASSDLTSEVRKRVEQKIGIPGGNLILSATHSHTGPDYGREMFSVVTGRPLPASAQGRQPYVPKMIEAVVAAVAQAHEAVRPVKIFSGSANQHPPVAFNRRYLLKTGEVQTWVGLNRPDVLRTAGPIDPEIGIILFRNPADNKPISVISNHALHLDTVGGTLWSADYPFFIERTLRESLGGDLFSLFGTGCCGNINHIDPRSTTRNSTEYIGTSLGKSIAAEIPKLVECAAPQLQFRREVVRLPLQSASDEQLAQAKKLLREIQAGKNPEFLEHVDAYKRLIVNHFRTNSHVEDAMELLGWGLSSTLAGSGETIPVEVQVLTLGRDVAIVSMPGEAFVEFGLEIKNASPFRTTLVVELSNVGETIYLPTRAAYVGGGYETINTTTLPGSGELLVEAAVRLLSECGHQVAEAEKTASK